MGLRTRGPRARLRRERQQCHRRRGGRHGRQPAAHQAAPADAGPASPAVRVRTLPLAFGGHPGKVTTATPGVRVVGQAVKHDRLEAVHEVKRVIRLVHACSCGVDAAWLRGGTGCLALPAAG
jgi:hypothetical protein